MRTVGRKAYYWTVGGLHAHISRCEEMPGHFTFYFCYNTDIGVGRHESEFDYASKGAFSDMALTQSGWAWR